MDPARSAPDAIDRENTLTATNLKKNLTVQCNVSRCLEAVTAGVGTKPNRAKPSVGNIGTTTQQFKDSGTTKS